MTEAKDHWEFFDHNTLLNERLIKSNVCLNPCNALDFLTRSTNSHVLVYLIGTHISE
jgi:hypothetical protein